MKTPHLYLVCLVLMTAALAGSLWWASAGPECVPMADVPCSGE